MIKIKKTAILVLICVLSAGMFFAILKTPQSAYADGGTQSVAEDTVEPRLFTTLDLWVEYGNGKVVVHVKNNFTLFPSTVKVTVELYSSLTKCNDYKSMTLAANNSTADLNMGETLSASAPTNGEQRYWQGRIYYRIDSAAYEERTTGVNLCDGNGNKI